MRRCRFPALFSTATKSMKSVGLYLFDRLSFVTTREYLGGHKSQLATSFPAVRSEEHTSELQSRENLVCRLLLDKKKQQRPPTRHSQLRWCSLLRKYELGRL